MNIIVCIKQVFDPEIPPTGFKINLPEKRVIPPPGTALVMNPFDKNALEAALRLKDTCGCKVTALAMGPPDAEDVLRLAMAMGADEGILLEYNSAGDFDSFATAYLLAETIKRMGGADLILCGREAGDWNSAQVGFGIAELLGLPSISLVKHIALVGSGLRVERVVPNGFEVVEVALPALLTVTNELGNPRYPTVPGIMAAKRKKLTVLRVPDIGIDDTKLASHSSRLKLIDLSVPVHESLCHIFKAETLEEAGVALAQKIMELNPNQ